MHHFQVIFPFFLFEILIIESDDSLYVGWLSCQGYITPSPQGCVKNYLNILGFRTSGLEHN